MRLVAVGVNHSSAPLALRERLSKAAGDSAALASLRLRVPEGFILSTCGRTEIYAHAPVTTDPVVLLAEALSTTESFDDAELRASCYAHLREDAVRHALRVTSGLDSIVLGEDQIHAQMKKALVSARAARTLGAVTERLGAAALSCSKRVRTHTGLSRHGVSLESLAVRAAEERVPGADLGGLHILVIGAGESAAIVLKRLQGARAAAVTVVSRTASRAQELAHAHGVQARGVLDAVDLADALVGADVVFCCTSAPHPVVTPELLAPRLAVRAEARLVCVDLGMPRDVHPDVALHGVQIVSLATLAARAEAHRASRREHVPAAEAIVARETARFMDWLASRMARSSMPGAVAWVEAMPSDKGRTAVENTTQ